MANTLLQPIAELSSPNKRECFQVNIRRTFTPPKKELLSIPIPLLGASTPHERRKTPQGPPAASQ
ncbi:unnamed protein product, partial [Vitis vinifera]